METLFLNILKHRKVDKVWLLKQFEGQFKNERELLIIIKLQALSFKHKAFK